MNKFWRKLIMGGAIGASIGALFLMRRRARRAGNSPYMVSRAMPGMPADLETQTIRPRLFARRSVRPRV